jgi:xanthine/CO dehydrogenase XdhC/CoxF family maturation factor
MNLGLRELATFLAEHKQDKSLVLATVTATEGSSYRKPGAMMLIRENHQFAGLISGGCLEGDLVEHADAVFRDGSPRQVTYDLSSDDDTILGLGLGCGGVVHLLLQRLDADAGFGFLPILFEWTQKRSSCVLALVRHGSGELPAGTWALGSREGDALGHPGLAKGLVSQLKEWNAHNRYQYSGEDGAVLLVRIEPSPRVLICGAGPDAVPVARQVDALGWESVVVDHRGAYADPERFPESATVRQIQAVDLDGQVNIAAIDAAIVMSHNLVHDATYLRQLAGRGLAYLGLLGPGARREQLQSDLDIADQLIHGPAGFDIGAELPESIALSILAEIHTVLYAGKSADDE